MGFRDPGTLQPTNGEGQMNHHSLFLGRDRHSTRRTAPQSPGAARPAAEGRHSRPGTAAAARRSAIRRRARGVTLTEALAVVAITLILITTAIPSMYNTIRSNTLTVEANRFTTVLMKARSEARKRKARVTLCKSADGVGCSDLTTVFWEDGWIMFIDDSEDGSLNALPNEDETVLLTESELGGTSLRTGSDFTHYVSFLADGRGIGSGDTDPPASGTFRLCDSRGTDYAREVVLSPIGRASVQSGLGTSQCP